MWVDADFPADPYPGAAPPASFVHADGTVWPRRRGRGGSAGSTSTAGCAARGAPPAAARIPVLTYGSNRCPSKITWLRRELGLPPTRWWCCGRSTTGVAAVWAAGCAPATAQRPAVFAAAPGVREDHAVWLATPDQIAVLDRCEGRDDRFRLARLRTADPLTVRAEDGSGIDRSLVLPRARRDPPPAAGGRSAGALRRRRAGPGPPARGEPGPGDGLDADTWSASPTPTSGRPRCSPTACCSPGRRRGGWSARTRPARPARRPSPAPCSTPAAATRPGCRGSPGPRPGVVVPAARSGRAAARPGRLRGARVPADPGGRAGRRHGVLGVRVARRPGGGLRPLPSGWAAR